MQISFQPVPARFLPEGAVVSVTEGSWNVVYLISEDASLPQICAALSTVTTEYASQSWVHVGLPDEMADVG